MKKEILFINHHEETELGIMEHFFTKKNFNITVIKPLNSQTLPMDINNFSGVVILGGAMNVEDTKEFPELKKELDWVNK